MEINNRVAFAINYDKNLEKNTKIEDNIKDLGSEYKSSGGGKNH